MPKVKVSEKYEIVIPQSIREKLSLKPGEEIEIQETEERKGISIKPSRPVKSFCGILKGMDTSFERDADRL